MLIVVCFFYASQEASLDRPSRMLMMYANRSNARWAESRACEVPNVYDVGRLQQLLGGGQAQVFRGEVIKLLRQGGLAVQVCGC